MLVLGIETTCDETAASLVVDGKKILSNVTSSQIPWHLPFGGVVPEVAARKHIEFILPVIQEATKEVSLSDINLIAFAQGPGLIGPLLIGLNTAKGLALGLNRPFIGVNHLEAHLSIAMYEENPPLPAIGLIASGGHTSLLIIEGKNQLKVISQTVDDAIGESFDKIAKLLSLPYPGGPEIEKLAKNGDSSRYPFKPSYVKGDPLAFSFSGLKTAVLYALQKEPKITLEVAANIAASFQRAAFETLIDKLELAIQHYRPKSLVFGGGVTSSLTLRNRVFEKFSLPILFPPEGLCVDNAAMIAVLGFHKWQENPQYVPESLPWNLEPLPTHTFKRV